MILLFIWAAPSAESQLSTKSSRRNASGYFYSYQSDGANCCYCCRRCCCCCCLLELLGGGDIRSPRSGQIIDKGNKQCKYHSLEISLAIYLQGASNHRKGKRRSMILDCSFIHNYSHLTSNLPVRAWNRSPSVPVGAGRSWSEPGCNVAT